MKKSKLNEQNHELNCLLLWVSIHWGLNQKPSFLWFLGLAFPKQGGEEESGF